MQTNGIIKVHPGFTIDCVIFSFYQDKLNILLNKWKETEKWMLPNSYLLNNEGVDDTARRVLTQLGINNTYLRQFHLFGAKDRINEEENRILLEMYGIKEGETNKNWQRFISVAYLSFVRYDKLIISEDKSDSLWWCPIDNLPEMYGDHRKITEKALESVKTSMDYMVVAYELLSERFTISELRRVYEEILGKQLDRRNFQKKMLLSGIITKLGEVKRAYSYPRPLLFTFNKDKLGISKSLKF